MKKILLTIYLAVSMCSLLHAQSWKWGKRGGSFASTSFSGPQENVIDMTTDKWGNVYVLANVFGYSHDVDGNSKTGYGGEDICIASFKCDGTYRWSKIIGAGTNDLPSAIKTDTLGGVYITGFTEASSGYGPCYIDTDTVISVTNKTMFLLKYDTGGVYKWNRMPEAATVPTSAITYTRVIDLDVDGAGNAFLLCRLPIGAYAGGSYTVSIDNQLHMLKYDAGGNFIGGFPMSITFNTYSIVASNIHMKRDYKRDRYYVAGAYQSYLHDTLYFGSTLINYPTFMGCFDNSGGLVWVKQNNDTDAGGINYRPVLDDSDYIYIVGETNRGDVFNGYTFTNPLSTINYSMPFIIKLDADGNNVWVLNTQSAESENFGYAISYSAGTVGLWGLYYGHLKAGAFDISSPTNTGARSFLATVNIHTGAVMNLDTLTATFGTDVMPTAVAADRLGNYYGGGSFASSLYVNGTTLNNSGGETDFFVAKFGYDNCNCSSPPTASFSFTGDNTIDFTFTGTLPADSVIWNFGDGSTSNVTNPSHIYIAAGAYTVCVTIYTPCGSSAHCQSVATTAVASLNVGEVSVYPNPVADQLIVAHAEQGAIVKLISMIGEQVFSGEINSDKYIINTSGLAPGAYLLQLGFGGKRSITTIIKQ